MGSDPPLFKSLESFLELFLLYRKLYFWANRKPLSYMDRQAAYSISREAFLLLRF